jgi:hypothetical protein
MKRSNLFVLIALTAQLVPIPWPSPFCYAQSPETARRSATQQSNAVPSVPSIKPSPTPLLNLERGNDADESNYQAAQYRLNRLQTAFNIALVVFTFALVVVGGWQARRLRQTLDQMRESSEKQLRAYVHVSSATVKKSANSRSARVVIKNFGQTPAYEVKFWMGTRVEAYPLPTNIALKEPSDDFPMSLEILAPNRSSIMEVPIEPQNTWAEQELLAGSAAIYAWGRIAYRDPFTLDKGNQPRITRFRLMCRGENTPTGKMSPDREGNQAT